MLLRCCLLHITIIILRQILYLVYLDFIFSLYLIFCQFQPAAGYKSIAYKKSVYLWQSLYSVKSNAFNIFFWTTLDGCVCIMKIVLWEASFFRHQNNTQTTKVSLQKLLDIKNEGSKCYLGKKSIKHCF